MTAARPLGWSVWLSWCPSLPSLQYPCTFLGIGGTHFSPKHISNGSSAASYLTHGLRAVPHFSQTYKESPRSAKKIPAPTVLTHSGHRSVALTMIRQGTTSSYQVKVKSEVTQSCPTLWDPMDYSPPGCSVHGISRQEYWSGLPFPSPSSYQAHTKSQSLYQEFQILISLIPHNNPNNYLQNPPMLPMRKSKSSKGIECHQ